MLNGLVEASLRYKFLVLIIFAVVAFLGVSAVRNVPIDAFPDVTPVQVNVYTETPGLAAEDVERVIQTMNSLKKTGIRFSMDDFGTGYSSLSYLSRLPLDEIKIDRAFVCELGHKAEGRAMVTTILNMASILKLQIVAEGVETAEQNDFLLNNGCQVFQGYLYSRPLTQDQFVAFYRERQSVLTPPQE